MRKDLKKWRPTYAHKPVGMERIAGFCMAALTIGLVCLALFGCAHGPNKKKLRTLLSECREVNREHLRLLKEYEKMDCKAHPEQGLGSAEMGLGGF